MDKYTYQNILISKKQLKQLLAWSFTKYNSIEASLLADELKYLGFKYATQAGISISIEDLKVPFMKVLMLKKSNQEILNAQKVWLKGKITDVERYQKIIDTWNITSDGLKNEVVYYFKNYDPLNSVYIMSFSGARGNLSQVRQLVGMRGLMSDPSGEILNLPIKKNFREGLTVTDYLISGYGARKGIVDTALKTANSGYLTRRLIDVAQDILIREKDCLTMHSFLMLNIKNKMLTNKFFFTQIFGRLINKPIYDNQTNELIAQINTEITPTIIRIFLSKNVKKFYIRSPLTCSLYRAICQKCYGWDLANENSVNIGEAIGIIAGQSIGEPGTQLTMRTFHTGGIFTSEANQQLISPVEGLIKFSEVLKTLILRTTRGEDVLITKNSGSLIIIPKNEKHKLVQVELLRNTILFIKNNQYIKENEIIGELTNDDKQIRTEVKPILTKNSGEIFIPYLKNKVHLINSNKLLWILSGQLYQAPMNSFLNFNTDHKLNKNSYIYRTKIINQYSGIVNFVNKKKDLFKRMIQIANNNYFLLNSSVQKLLSPLKLFYHIFNFNNLKYMVPLEFKNSKAYFNVKINKIFGILLTNNFFTLTGGTAYYNCQINFSFSSTTHKIAFYKNFENGPNPKTLSLAITKKLPIEHLYFFKPFTYQKLNYFCKSLQSPFPIKKRIIHRSIIWLSEETYNLNCDSNSLLVENGNFISENFEIIPGTFSKTAGIVKIVNKNNSTQKISVKSGFLYKGKNFENLAGKIFYPGEIVLKNIKNFSPSFCEQINDKFGQQLLIRPLTIYEVPLSKSINKIFGKNNHLSYLFNLHNKIKYLYASSQKFKTANHLNLISNILSLKSKKSFYTNFIVEFRNHRKNNRIDFNFTEKLCLINYISPHLKYVNICSSLLIEKNQFVDSYTVLGYLEALSVNLLEIVRFKYKSTNIKQIFLISNKDCLTIKKNKIKNKIVSDLIINKVNVNQIGKIIIDNNEFLTIQKGRPYFFPNCKTEDSIKNKDLCYKVIRFMDLPFFENIQIPRSVFLNYYDITVRKAFQRTKQTNRKIILERSKMFIKKNGKLYSSVLLPFFKQFSIKKPNNKIIIDPNLSQQNTFYTLLKKTAKTKEETDFIKLQKKRKKRTLLLQNSGLTSNQFKDLNNLNYKLILVQLRQDIKLEEIYKTYGINKLLDIYSLTDDYFEQETNYLYCRNGEFVDSNKTIGLLNFEKEITGDIVQGLPRIEELLEARKKKLRTRRVPTNQKKSLLVQKSSIDSNFEFRKIGTSIKENEKLNPHIFLKVYFNYYGLLKTLLCYKNNRFESCRLINIYEASYRTFKKVQVLILNSVQSVYKSQSVSIANKHLEVIIKQMTTKVFVTNEGNTPLLPQEVIDLYHIKYINDIIINHRKCEACYIPLLLGITKSALNNPSFISAASFQETTRVLTKAALEGRLDWLRGLKENIIIGHLIPAGTGYRNYINSFKSPAPLNQKLISEFYDLKNFNLKS
uniref:DNA-directed RNA polymerase subunit beta'' n=1 Tax=Biddulphia biddulphiana TaxID=1158022 RepID=A0A2U9NSK1_9STRA|nr:RNA polymerase beta' subunit [Biddulphia biddulphiana]AWT40068.1 RNA polymerase beta' subunit [Biddulphia biddulphiana]